MQPAREVNPGCRRKARVLASSPWVYPAPGPRSLTDAQVGVDGGVAGSASQVLVFPVGDVLVGAGVPVLLGQAEVNDVHQVALLPQPHEEVVGLDVPVYEVLGVDVLDAADLGEGRASRSAHVPQRGWGRTDAKNTSVVPATGGGGARSVCNHHV